ncbi:hypothetical protein Dimus_001273 [Dionaea muscipula]
MALLLPPSQFESKLIARSDDREEVVKERLRIYNEMWFFVRGVAMDSDTCVGKCRAGFYFSLLASMSHPVEEFYRSRGTQMKRKRDYQFGALR